MVKELGVAYYGNVYLDHAQQDFKEIQEHGCNAVLIAMSEFDFHNWRNHIYDMMDIAKKEFGFKTYLNFWAWGRVFGGEPPSVFLNNYAEHRQIFSGSGRPSAAACPNSPAFQKYLNRAIKKVARVQSIDAFFWDEPHFSYGESNITVADTRPYYNCHCPTCQQLFKRKFDNTMPIEETPEVHEFKEVTLLNFLQNISKTVKKVDSSKEITICSLPPNISSGLSSDWERLCFPEMDRLATDPYWAIFGKDMDYIREVSEKLITTTKKMKKKSQLWLLAFMIKKNKEEEVGQAARIIEGANPDSIFAWHYRGGLGSFIKSDNPAKVWEIVGTEFNRIKKGHEL